MGQTTPLLPAPVADAVSLKQQLRRMAALARLELLTEPQQFDQSLQRIVDVTARLMPASVGASIILWDEATDSFITSTSTLPGQPTGYATKRVRRNSGATTWIMQHRRPRVVPDVARDEMPANAMLLDFGIRAFVGAPLLSQGRVIGVLYAMDGQPRQYAPEDVDFLQVLAGRAAAVVETLRLVEQLQRQATRDNLTGVYQFGHFVELAQRVLADPENAGTPVAVIFADVDHFKAINDRYGHLVGDDVLRQVAARLGEKCRKRDLLGRFGGEEFVLFLPGADRANARRIAERLRCQLTASPVFSNGQAIPVTASFGVSSSLIGRYPLRQLLDAADQALYRAKERGRNRVAYRSPDGG